MPAALGTPSPPLKLAVAVLANLVGEVEHIVELTCVVGGAGVIFCTPRIRLSTEPPNYKHATQQRLCDYAVLAAGRRPRRLSIYLTELTVHGGSELITG